MSFNPSQLSGLTLYLDASVATSLDTSTSSTYPSAGTIANGAQIGTWFDKSGNGYHFSQSTSGLQPIYHSSGGTLNNAPYIQMWDSTTDSTGNGPVLVERSAGLYSALENSETILILLYKRNQTEHGGFQTFIKNNTNGQGRFFLLRIGGNFERYSAGSTAAMGEGSPYGLAYTFAQLNGSLGTENFYVSSAAGVGFTTSNGTIAVSNTAFAIAGDPAGYASACSEYYEVIAYNRSLSSAEIAEIFAFWNTKYATTFNVNPGALTVPTVSPWSITQNSLDLISYPPFGGVAPFAYQWYRSTNSGTASSIAVSGNAISGATSPNLADTGLSAETSYNYVLKVSDSASSVALSPVSAQETHGTSIVKIGFIGDSISAGYNSSTDPATQFGIAMATAYPNLDVQVYNYAVGGQKLRELSRLTYMSGSNGGGLITGIISQMQSDGVTYASIMEGTNDWAQIGTDSSLTPANAALDMADVIAALHAANITLYVNNTIFRSDGGSGADDPTTGLPAYNAAYAGLAYSGTIRRGDTAAYAFFKANQGLLGDGLHPDTQGSIALAGYWAAALGPSIALDVTPPLAPPSTNPVITIANTSTPGVVRVTLSTTPSGETAHLLKNGTAVSLTNNHYDDTLILDGTGTAPVYSAYYSNSLGTGDIVTKSLFQGTGSSENFNSQLQAPTGVTATPGRGHITLTWGTSPAAQYVIVVDADTLTLIAAFPYTPRTGTLHGLAARTYNLMVSFVDSVGNQSGPSTISGVVATAGSVLQQILPQVYDTDTLGDLGLTYAKFGAQFGEYLSLISDSSLSDQTISYAVNMYGAKIKALKGHIRKAIETSQDLNPALRTVLTDGALPTSRYPSNQ